MKKNHRIIKKSQKNVNLGDKNSQAIVKKVKKM